MGKPIIAIFYFLSLFFNCYSQNNTKRDKILLIRCDDIGINKSVNSALVKLIDKKIPISASVIVNAPQFEEAAIILNKHPEISVGIHLTLNCEWNVNRWGPVLKKEDVPSLVDSNGYFFSTRKEFFSNDPRIDEIEKELTAQVAKALSVGLKIDYLDYHLSTAVSTKELQFVVRKIAKKFNIALSDFYGEINMHVYAEPIQEKKKSLIKKIQKIDVGKIYLLITHVGLNTAEMKQMIDQNSIGVASIGEHREEELHALLSTEFSNVIKSKDIQLMNYRKLISIRGIIN